MSEQPPQNIMIAPENVPEDTWEVLEWENRALQKKIEEYGWLDLIPAGDGEEPVPPLPAAEFPSAEGGAGQAEESSAEREMRARVAALQEQRETLWGHFPPYIAYQSARLHGVDEYPTPPPPLNCGANILLRMRVEDVYNLSAGSGIYQLWFFLQHTFNDLNRLTLFIFGPECFLLLECEEDYFLDNFYGFPYFEESRLLPAKFAYQGFDHAGDMVSPAFTCAYECPIAEDRGFQLVSEVHADWAIIPAAATLHFEIYGAESSLTTDKNQVASVLPGLMVLNQAAFPPGDEETLLALSGILEHRDDIEAEISELLYGQHDEPAVRYLPQDM